jgi:alkanesulfonate monooxygenase SsuD/methylene tetrahydromethanopterin reductase-like flavin-dependent oxidoreductase (luciferase family)
MRIGVTVPMSMSDGRGRVPSWTEILAFAEHAEAVGLDSVWVCDHLLSSPPGRPVEGIHEGWTIVSALAATTKRLVLGQLVTCITFRSPALLAKMAATADAISSGRLVLGIGAGWDDAEHVAFGYPVDNRVERLEEALEVVLPLLRGESVSFAGRHYVVDHAQLLPPPGRQIPVLIAANRPRTIRVAARHADAWNTAWYGGPDDRLRSRLAQLDAALLAEGRDPAGMRRTVGMRVEVAGAATAGQLARAVAAYEQLGIDDLIIGLAPMISGSLDHLAEALER